MIVQINVAFGFFPELDYDTPVDNLEGNRHLGVLRSTSFPFPEDRNSVGARSGCFRAKEEGEEEETKLLARLKRMVSCS